MKLFDSHSHIDDQCFDNDFDEMLKRALESSVYGIMVVGINDKTSKKAIELAKTHKNLITSVGVHPHDAKTCSDSVIKTLETLALKHSCVRAWGETGLDFNRMHSPSESQEKWFERQIYAASKLNLPIIFHERDSNGRFLEILESANLKEHKGVVHCFSGSKEEMFKYLDLGYYIGITGILTIKKRGEALRSLSLLVPEDRILIETDAPYLTPAPQKNKIRRNEPGFVKSVMLKLAQIKNADVEELSKTIWQNTIDLFGTI
ncbi:TatD family hydrolase [Candidatus Parcubacteria bacterium]|nr:TatD family hydrolase [Candidatus Parcubacteria bacterium]MCK5542962.1 TatD family hydrolase [Desulfobacterales bacterium]